MGTNAGLAPTADPQTAHVRLLNPQFAVRNPQLIQFLSREEGENLRPVHGLRSDGGGRFGQVGRHLFKAQLPLEFLRHAGNDRPKQNAQSPANFGQGVKYIIQPGGLGRVLGQLERAGLVNVLVGPGDQGRDAQQRLLQLMAAITRHHPLRGIRPSPPPVDWSRAGRGRCGSV